MVLFASAFAGCGGKVEVVPQGAGGSGSTSVGTTTGDTTTSTSASTGSGMVVPPDPPCPTDQPPVTSECSQEGLSCTWHVGGCAITLTCIKPPANDPNSCGSKLGWAESQNDCGGCADGFGPCVPCESAHQGDPCNAVGYECPGSFGGNCSGVRHCGADHTWYEGTQDFCCI